MDSEITKCEGKDCPIKMACSRFTRMEERFQVWFLKSPYNKEVHDCEMYISNGTRTFANMPPNCS